MATIVKRAIRTAAGWATMSAPEKAVYDDIYFETLTAWEASIPADLVAADEQWVAEWYNDWPTGLVDDLIFSGARITDSTRDVILSTADGEGHNGDLTGCLLDGTIIVRNGYYTIKGFRITGDAGVGVNTTTHSGSEEIIIDSLIIHDSTKIGLTHDANNVNWVVRNTLFINTYRAIYTTTVGSTAEAQNCTAINCGDYGILRIKSINCVSFGHTSGDFLQGSTGSDYNASEDSTAPGSNSINNITLADFTDPANGDYSVAAGSQLIDAGTDLSSEFTTDIIGTVRG